MRQNIFEQIKSNWNVSDAIRRIHRLFQNEKAVSCSDGCKRYEVSLLNIVDNYCFELWANNGHMLCLHDFLEALYFDEMYKKAVEENSEESTINYIEIVENCLYLFMSKYRQLDFFKYGDIRTTAKLRLLNDNLNDVLDHLNMKVEYFAEKEQAIIIERDPAVTAAAEISSNETAYEIIFYNHHTLKGNTKEKAKILNYLANEFEAQRKALNQTNYSLASDIAFLLNSLNIRHNNVDQKLNSYHSTVAQMPSNELEAWYDELYQMLLLARLEIDNIERKQKVADLKKEFESEKQNNG